MPRRGKEQRKLKSYLFMQIVTVPLVMIYYLSRCDEGKMGTEMCGMLFLSKRKLLSYEKDAPERVSIA